MRHLTLARSQATDVSSQAPHLGNNTICYVYPSGKIIVSPRQSAMEIAALELTGTIAQGDG
ncbi:hypothetical protein [Trichothermofontia sp.]